MIRKPFKEWEYEEVQNIFGIKKEKNFAPLLSWLHVQTPILNEWELQMIETLRNDLIDNVMAWNEDELKMFCIAPLLNLVHFSHYPYYKSFTQRQLFIKNDVVETQGNVEFMIAKGEQNPQNPFFFLHEYKQENLRNNDPLGQLLVAMVAAQLQNPENMPLYGCYVSGRNWFFVLLYKQKYGLSLAYDLTISEKIIEVIGILKAVKVEIEKYFEVE